MEMKPNSAIVLNSSLDGDFFRVWLKFLRPFHKLTDRETDVLASFLKHRYQLSKVVKDPELLDKILMNDDTKKKIREECGMTQAHFQVIMTKLKKNRLIDKGKINPKFIPKVNENSTSFQFLLSFHFK